MNARDRRATLRAVFLLVQAVWVLVGLTAIVRGSGDGTLYGAMLFVSGLINLVAFAVWEGFTVFGMFPRVEDDKPETKPE